MCRCFKRKLESATTINGNEAAFVMCFKIRLTHQFLDSISVEFIRDRLYQSLGMNNVEKKFCILKTYPARLLQSFGKQKMNFNES